MMPSIFTGYRQAGSQACKACHSMQSVFSTAYSSKRQKLTRIGARSVYVPDDTSVNTPDAFGFLSWQQDLQRINLLLQDPRPLDEKQGLLAEEVQATIATYVERGAMMEADALSSLGRALPNEFVSSLPLELRNALSGGTGPAVTNAQPGASTTPVAVQQPIGMSTLVDNQTAAEMVDVRFAVEGLRDAIGRLSTNQEGDQEGVLKLNVRERREALARSIAQLSPGTLSVQDVSVIAAVSEASQLLAEVDSLPV